MQIADLIHLHVHEVLQKTKINGNVKDCFKVGNFFLTTLSENGSLLADSAGKYPNIFSREMEVITYLYPKITEKTYKTAQNVDMWDEWRDFLLLET